MRLIADVFAALVGLVVVMAVAGYGVEWPHVAFVTWATIAWSQAIGAVQRPRRA